MARSGRGCLIKLIETAGTHINNLELFQQAEQLFRPLETGPFTKAVNAKAGI